MSKRRKKAAPRKAAKPRAAKVKKSKAPKKPKRSASLKVWERYEERVRNWQKKENQKVADERKRQSIIKKYSR